MSTNRRPEQLTLLQPSEAPVRFRLDQRTRELGLAHVAEIRRQLATMHGTDDQTGRHHQAVRHDTAA